MIIQISIIVLPVDGKRVKTMSRWYNSEAEAIEKLNTIPLCDRGRYSAAKPLETSKGIFRVDTLINEDMPI